MIVRTAVIIDFVAFRLHLLNSNINYNYFYVWFCRIRILASRNTYSISMIHHNRAYDSSQTIVNHLTTATVFCVLSASSQRPRSAKDPMQRVKVAKKAFFYTEQKNGVGGSIYCRFLEEEKRVYLANIMTT